MVQGASTIELTAEERAWLGTIQFDPLALRGNHQAFLENAEIAYRLATSLLERGGIPEPRRRYFTDPEYNPGGRGRSRMGGFERNGTSGEEILRHPHFLKYLRYFIYGADLPAPVLRAFREAVEDCGPVSSGDIAPLGTTARNLARTHHLEGGAAADEFQKLCLDLGMSPGYATSIRASVKQLRSSR